MIRKISRVRLQTAWVPITYALICLLALGFDLVTDRSFGALMLATLPISLVALGCLLIGPWLEGRRKFVAARDWFVGALLILLITLGFGALGVEQAKTGELIFTYAVLIMLFPASLVLPFVTMSIEPMLNSNVFLRIISGWTVCIALGWLEWKALSWLLTIIRQRIQTGKGPGSD